MRGTPRGWHLDLRRSRFTPARAGNAVFLLHVGQDFRFIPARAGNASLAHRRSSERFIPARAGNARVPIPTANGACGSSPRMRGPHREELVTRHLVRFIPAHAGNAASRSLGSPCPPVHPRACGERCASKIPGWFWSGSSPRVRGTRPALHPVRPDGRFIPAHAGNAVKTSVIPRWGTVHPRACGEHPKKRWVTMTGVGSSLRVRGTLRRLRGFFRSNKILLAAR